MTRLRTWLAFVMLVGIFVMAVTVLVVLVAVLVWFLRHGVNAVVLGAFTSGVAFIVVMSLRRVLRHDSLERTGVPLLPTDQPELWATVRRAADGVGTRAPDEIRLVQDANASVMEDSRWLGLVGGLRVLHIGVPLFQTLTRNQMLFVLSHEMGHYSERHTALSGVTRRGMVALGQTVDDLGPRTVLGRIFGGYYELYAKVLLSIRRRQELDADRWAAELAGSEDGIAALRTIVETALTYEEFSRDYALVGVSIGLAPQALFGGYSEFLSDPLRTPLAVDALIAAEQPAPSDTHPLTSRRISRLHERRILMDQSTLSYVDESALLLLHDAVAVTTAVENLMWKNNSLVAVPWKDLFTRGARRRTEERALQVMSAFDDLGPDPANLNDALSAVAHGSGPDVIRLLAGGPVPEEETLPFVREILAVLVSAAFLSSGQASYVLRWDRADVLVDEAGVEVDVEALVVDLPGNGAAAEWLMKFLEGEGISRQWSPALSGTRTGLG